VQCTRDGIDETSFFTVFEASSDQNQNLEVMIHEAIIRDYTLEKFDELGLFSEYLEMGLYQKIHKQDFDQSLSVKRHVEAWFQMNF